jgi:hypothetical protein
MDRASLLVGRASFLIGTATVSFFPDAFVEPGAALAAASGALTEERGAQRRESALLSPI